MAAATIGSLAIPAHPAAVEFGGEVILPKGDGTICCGYTLSIATDVAKARGLLNEKTADDLRRFQKLWYGDGEPGDKTLCVLAVQSLGVGREVNLPDARPGDFVQFWRRGGSGHSVIFLGWVMEDGLAVGFRYRSSQKSTDGIGDRTEYFSDDPKGRGGVLRKQTYVCRLHAGSGQKADEPTPEIAALIADGRFSEAESALRQRIAAGDSLASRDLSGSTGVDPPRAARLLAHDRNRLGANPRVGTRRDARRPHAVARRGRLAVPRDRRSAALLQARRVKPVPLQLRRADAPTGGAIGRAV